MLTNPEASATASRTGRDGATDEDVVAAAVVKERGSHDELLAAGGFYHRLYRSQFTEAFAEV